jgi:AraC family transcriptional regulator of adaptative response / DNA-3-methyladenine glycosylase II
MDGQAGSGAVACHLELEDLRDLSAAVERCRRLLDADCDPRAVESALATDDAISPLLRRWSGLRVPGHVDGDELAVRAVLGQQISVARARTLTQLLVERYGDPVPASLHPPGGRLFPTAATIASVDPAELPMPRARARALVGLGVALADGSIRLDRGADRAATEQALLELPGIGPWTAAYVAMRALGDPDVFMPTDAGVRAGMAALGLDPGHAERWRPWRSYAQMYVWGAAQAAHETQHTQDTEDTATGRRRT